MKTLNGLIREAGQSARFRGHALGRWARQGGKAIAICRACDMFVAVKTCPAPNEIDIGGEAVALDCRPEAAAVTKKADILPAPLSSSDLCACGVERREHSGRHGMGRSSRTDCPSFQEVQ